MAAETKVIVDMEQKGIEITCKHCEKSQTYTMRSKEIPKRPKTQCQNCEKWIYIDRSLLVRKFGQEDLVKKDQKRESLDITNQEERAKNTQKIKEPPSVKLTKQQRPKNNDQKRRGEQLNIDFTNGMSQDISIYNQTIPINIKQEITHWVLNNLDLLYKGAYYYSKAWEGRYKKRLREEPDSPVITDFHKMQKVIDKIKELKEFREKLEYPKKKVINNTKS
jgi:hypothetical protein